MPLSCPKRQMPLKVNNLIIKGSRILITYRWDANMSTLADNEVLEIYTIVLRPLWKVRVVLEIVKT